MDTNANSGASGATDTSSVTAIKVQVVLDTTTEQLKKQFSGIQTDIEKDPIGLTFGVDKKTSKDAIVKGLQDILGKGTNITIGAGVDPNAGNQVKKQVQNAANAGQQAANKSKVKIKVQTDVDDGTKNKLDAYYKRLKERYDLEAKIASSTVNGVINPELDGAGKRLKAVRAELKQLKSELQGKIPTDKYSKAYEIWHSGQAMIAAAGQSASGTLNRREATKNTTLTKQEVQEKLNEFYTQQKKAGALEQASLTLGNKNANSKELEAVKAQLEKAQESAKNLRTELSNLLPGEEIDKLTKFDNELDDNLTRIKGRIADQNAAKTKSEADAQLNAAKKAKISEYNSELSNFKKLARDSALMEKKNELDKNDSFENELPVVNQQMADSLDKINRLQTDLGNVFSKNELDELLNQYKAFESDLDDEITNSVSRYEAHYKDLQKVRNNTKATAEEKRQAKQTDTYTDDLATARNKYKNMSGVPTDVSSSLDNVQAQIDKLNTLKVGTEDYANQLKVIGTAWTDATRQMSAFDEAQKKTENHVKSMTEQALKWKESIKDSDTASQELRDSIDGIINASKKLDSDHSSETYKQGVKDLDDAFISAKASMSVYTDGYKDLESTARRALTEIRKKELELEQAGNHSFDSILIGDSKTDSLDGSLESQLNSLKGMNTQSATYKQRVSEIVDEWLKVKIQIEQALKSEEDLEKEAAKRQNQIRSQQKAYNSIMKTLGTADFTDKDSKTKAFFETSVNNDTKRTGAQAVAELQSEMAKLSETQPPAEYEQTLKNIKDLVVEINKQINEARNSSSNARADNTKNNHMQDLMRELYSYREKLIGFEGNQKLSEEYENLFNAIKTGALSFDEAQLKVSAFKNACHNAGLETETLGQKLSRLFKEHFQTAIAMAGVAMVKQGLREVYNNVVDIDDAMVELKKVTTESAEAYSQFSDRAAKTSRDLGASISDYVSATADWARLGYGLPDAEELARVSTLFANVGDGIENIADASSYMISILKGFDLAADDAQKVADLINEVANNEPASASDISEILTRSGAALHEAGNDLSQAISLGVAMNSVTQNAESTGQTLKTVSMYLRAAKTDLENMGESSDGCANSVSELRSELKQLTGVDIMKDAAGTQFESTYDILKEISEVWGSLTDVTRANVTEMLGGKRNANAVAAVLSQFEIAEKSMKDAANSAGSAAKENEVYLSSITGKLAQLDSAFQQLSQDLLDSSLIKFFVDFATAAVDIADGAVKAAGALPTLTAAISGVLSVMQMSGKLKNGAGKVNMPSYICCV